MDLNIYFILISINIMFFESYIFKYGKTIIIFSICLFLLGKYLNLTKLKIFGIFLFIFSYYFFRKPRFEPIVNIHDIKSPAYGKIYDIKRKKINGEGYIQVIILINITDVHIQYAPCSGKLNKMIYKKGEFNPVYFTNKSEYNERMMYYIQSNGNHGQVIFSQIAGIIARTIVPFVQENSILTQGQEIGLIKFGSRSDIFIKETPDLKLVARAGDKVIGGQSIIARYI